ncbi:MAG: GIY-YIG nuclease family protein [Flavobacteriales bacterium]|nr:GIY-YIG nuclease family protein [Flavobacteriales bacterium]
MSTTPPFILHILVADGDPDGLRVVERSNWNGRALMFPRNMYPGLRERAEFKQPGVYLLIGPREDGDGEKIYVGEGDPVGERIKSHYAKVDFWQRCVFFVSSTGNMNKAHIQYLEARLVALGRVAKRLPMENGTDPTDPTLSEMDRAFVEVFLQNLLGMLPVLGITAFEKGHGPVAVEKDLPLLHCEGRGITATGYDAPQGFIVREGSFAALVFTPGAATHFPSIVRLRDELVSNGVLALADGKYRFTQDCTFSSPSMASCVALGRPSNGRVDWKDGQGRTLKSIQEAQAS